MTLHSSDSVVITSRKRLSSSNEKSWSNLPSPYPLGPLDQLVAPFIPVAVVFIYRQPPGYPQIMPIDKLQESITRVLDHYPHLTGQLSINPQSGIHQIDHLGSGAELLEATSQSPLSSYTNPKNEIELLRLPDGGNDFLAPYDMSLESVCDGPVFTIQHTRFACGGVSLGIRVLHTINDAAGFFKLVSDLAEIYRSLSSSSSSSSSSPPDKARLAVLPITRPYLANFVSTATPDQIARAKSFKPTLYHLDPEPQAIENPSPSNTTSSTVPDGPEPAESTRDIPETPPLTPTPNTGRVLRFSTSDLTSIKSRATDRNSTEWVSTFDALSAFLHQRIYQARHRLRQTRSDLLPLSYPDLLSPVDVRRHLDFPLNHQTDSQSQPQSQSQSVSPSRGWYTGNAILTTYASFNPTDLLEGPLRPIAQKVHSMTRQSGVTDPETIKSTIEWIAVNDKSRIKNGFRFGNASLMLSQWNKVDMYGFSTFEKGVRPCLVAPPFTPISLLDGLGYYLPTPDTGAEGDRGGIDVYLALCDDVWAKLDISVF